MSDFETMGRTLKQFGAANPTVAEAPAADTHFTGEGAANLGQLIQRSESAPDGFVPSDSDTTHFVPGTPAQPQPTQPQVPETFIPRAQPVPPAAPIRPVQVDPAMQRDGLDQVFDVPSFTVINIDDSAMNAFTREYKPVVEMVDCVADIDMLFTYMVKTEHKMGVTLSMKAYGVDPIVFNRALGRDRIDDDSDAPRVVSIPVPDRDGDEEKNAALYELIEVDNALYLSCVSESLCPEYLYQVISEASEAVYTHGRYIYTMVGPRPMTVGADGHQQFIDTLKLNSYELSVLMHYMGQIPGVHVVHGKYNMRSAIMFEKV